MRVCGVLTAAALGGDRPTANANGVIAVICRKEVVEGGRKRCRVREEAARNCLTEARQASGVAAVMALGYLEGAALR